MITAITVITGSDVDHGSAISMVKDLIADHEKALWMLRAIITQ